MSVNGIESVVYGVDDLDGAARFYEDFGLPVATRDESGAVFALEEGSKVVLRPASASDLPPSWFDGPGVREVIWGVDSDAALERLVANVAADREVRRDDDGTAHFVADDGVGYGLRVYAKRQVVSAPSPVNAPGAIQRMNTHRTWRHRARPKVLAHVVFRVPDPGASFHFLQDRLGFKLTDVSRNLGVFARADGTYDHHNIFWLQAGVIPGLGHGFDHVCFSVEDIDELMVGANHMMRQGWKADRGVSRHRIASALNYYIDNPACGGQTEYGADSDYVDDTWVPRSWNFMFGGWMWSQNLPPFLANADAAWDVGFADAEHPWESPVSG